MRRSVGYAAALATMLCVAGPALGSTAYGANGGPNDVVGRPTPTPEPLRIVAISLTWPDGSSSQALAVDAQIPSAKALLRTTGAGTIVLQWLLDGQPLTVATRSVSAPGVQEFDLLSALPMSGAHCLDVNVVAPPQPLFGGLAMPLPIDYTIGDATPPPPPTVLSILAAPPCAPQTP